MILHITETGSGPPLLLLHGFTGSAAEWYDLLPELASGRRVIMPDLIGHGASAAPDDPARYTMERCVADLLTVLDQLELAQVDLLGYSMGGRVALHLAAAAPERINRLILESAAPGIADEAERAARAAADDALADQIEAAGVEWFVEHWTAIPLFASQTALPEPVRAAQRERRLAQRPHGLANSLRGMGAGRQASLWERLSDIDLPTLIISGEFDIKYVTIGNQMAEMMPQARHAIVPNAGHTVHLEQPQAFNKIVVRYLEAIP
jgi:2-succinyl-6-hydroxy-2,4-cyclohexadiene-1-carboxylate synthase